MIIRYWYFVLTLLLTCIISIESFSFNYISDYFYKIVTSVEETSCDYLTCCPRTWKSDDFDELSNALRSKVYGQKIMLEVVVSALKGHLQNSNLRSKALAISFHGRPGVGKNYVVNIIKEKLFFKKFAKKHVHFFSGRVHFTMENHSDLYKMQLHSWIKGNVSICDHSIFIFDEVDKIPHRVLDAVKPFLDYHDLIDGIDYRKVIFIFISNTGGELIAQEYLKYWKSGNKRNKLQLKHFEDLIRIGAFNEKGGFYKSETIESSLIDHYVPFLPLEEAHVRKCIEEEFEKRGFRPDAKSIEHILNEITFGPEENPIFSNAGCKRIAPKVSAYVEHKRFSTHDEF